MDIEFQGRKAAIMLKIRIHWWTWGDGSREVLVSFFMWRLPALDERHVKETRPRKLDGPWRLDGYGKGIVASGYRLSLWACACACAWLEV
jgi:hypothetical protein